MTVRFHDPTLLEFRHDRPYDEQSPGHLLMPNGSSVDSMDRQFLNAASREVLQLWTQVWGDGAVARPQEPAPPCTEDSTDGPRCERPECGEAIHYKAGASIHGGISEWVHTRTLSATCPDGGGVCGRPSGWDARRAS